MALRNSLPLLKSLSGGGWPLAAPVINSSALHVSQARFSSALPAGPASPDLPPPVAAPFQAVPMFSPITQIAVAYGDGIGPEIMQSVLDVMHAAGARIYPQVIEIGQKLYLSGHTSGITPSSWDVLRNTKVFLKAPITTPVGGGYKSLNVSVRKTLGLFANVRPCVTYAPCVRTSHPNMNLVIIRENEEDLYAGIEHRQTNQVTQCLKIITRPGTERIIRYAFDYAVAHGRRKVTCMVKDNIMKFTDGLFAKIFEEIGAEYPNIEKQRMIIDIGTARLATRPTEFDVIVLPNLYGDILSDVAAELAGSVGIAASSNLGENCAMFEAIHGSAPDIAGQDIANPSGLLLSAVQMLVHIHQPDVAERIHNAWLRTVEDGVHTGDIYDPNLSRCRVGTRLFTAEVIRRLGLLPEKLRAVSYQVAPDLAHPRPADAPTITANLASPPVTMSSPGAVSTKIRAQEGKMEKKELVGVDIFLDWTSGKPDDLGSQLLQLCPEKVALKMITNRGVKVWPQGYPETFCTDHWRCRFRASEESDAPFTHDDVLTMLSNIKKSGLEFIKMELLYTFDGKPGFALGQGE